MEYRVGIVEFEYDSTLSGELSVFFLLVFGLHCYGEATELDNANFYARYGLEWNTMRVSTNVAPHSEARFDVRRGSHDGSPA